MSQEKQFLVSGAKLKCPCGTITCKLKAGKEYASMLIGAKTFLSVQATKEGENIEGFGMCLSQKCTGGTIPCTARMLLAGEWVNPVTLNSVLLINEEDEAIHREAKLLCISGRASIQALTTGQVELTESEEKFYKYMREMFGFDDDIIEIMLKVIYAIDEAYPNESERMKAWRFARLMGGFSYGFGEENKFIEIRHKLDPEGSPDKGSTLKSIVDSFKWKVTAGDYPDINIIVDEKDYFVNKLHLSEDEYYKLRFHVMAQHEITSRPACCFPDYITVGIEIPGSDGKMFIHPYNEVWKNFFEKIDSEGDFAVEWEKLYKQYVDIPEDVYELLASQYTLFADYTYIESNTKDYPIGPNYSDFAHQQILTATITLENAVADNQAGNSVKAAMNPLKVLDSDYVKAMFGPISLLPSFNKGLDSVAAYADVADEAVKYMVHAYRTSLAGWLGDIRLADSKMSEDDYKADLDGLNLSNLIIKEDISTIEAINEYYSALESGAITREKEFLCNMGDGEALKGYENIKTLDNLYESIFEKTAGNIESEKFMERIAVGLE